MDQVTPSVPRGTYTVRQFCDAHHIGPTFFYDLVKTGRGPRLMKVGKRTLISVEAAADWRRAQESKQLEAA